MQQALAQTNIPHYLFRADAVDENDTGGLPLEEFFALTPAELFQ